MNTSDEDVIIRYTVAASIEIIASNTPLKAKSIKSTFNVTPEQNRHLELIARMTGKTKQDCFAFALDEMIRQKSYLDDIPIEQIKALMAK